MQHVQLHATFFSCIGQVAKDNFSTSDTRTHKIHHNLDLEEVTTFPLIIFFVLGHGGYTQMSFSPRTPKLGVPKFLKLRLLQL